MPALRADGGGGGVDLRARFVVSIVVLAVAWAVTLGSGALPLYPAVVVAGLVSGAAGLWVRAAAGRVPLPPFRVTPSQAGLAVVVALVHFGAGHLLFELAARLLPALTETATGVYARTGGMPLAAQVVLAAGVTAPLEELFWRGAVHPLMADAVACRQERLPAWLRPDRRPGAGWLVPVLASTLAYAVFHLVTGQLALVAAALLGGLVWATLLERTRSLGACMLAHAVWIALMVAVPPV